MRIRKLVLPEWRWGEGGMEMGRRMGGGMEGSRIKEAFFKLQLFICHLHIYFLSNYHLFSPPFFFNFIGGIPWLKIINIL